MIIVITRNGDVHGQYMIGLLKEMGEEVTPLIYSEFPTRSEFSFFHSGLSSALTITFSSGVHVRSDLVRSVLNRRHDEPEAPTEIIDKAIRQYVVSESRAFLKALPQILGGFWVSNPDKIEIASRKPYQLSVAAELGFITPLTLVTNSPIDAEQFLDSVKGDVIIKMLYSPGIRMGTEGQERYITFFTRRLQREQVLPYIKRTKNCPIIIQPYIEKKFELRITVVGRKVFTCAIYSQKSLHTQEDWRRYDLQNTPHEPYELPREIEQRCIRLVENLGLYFGCIDMIVTPSGDYIFLEINPNGQWLWIEQITGMPISRTLVELLISGSAK